MSAAAGFVNASTVDVKNSKNSNADQHEKRGSTLKKKFNYNLLDIVDGLNQARQSHLESSSRKKANLYSRIVVCCH
jgi:molecular chaperone GrpE (heat shock protein)